MPERERRSGQALRGPQLRAQLNDDQKQGLVTLEHFGWHLRFIRRPLFQTPIAVVCDSTTGRYAVLRPDGTLQEDPGFAIRH